MLYGEVYQENFMSTTASTGYQLKFYSPGSGNYVVEPQGKLNEVISFVVNNPDVAVQEKTYTLAIIRIEDSDGNEECTISGTDNSTFSYYRYASETNRTKFIYLYHYHASTISTNTGYTLPGIKCSKHYKYNWIIQ